MNQEALIRLAPILMNSDQFKSLPVKTQLRYMEQIEYFPYTEQLSAHLMSLLMAGESQLTNDTVYGIKNVTPKSDENLKTTRSIIEIEKETHSLLHSYEHNGHTHAIDPSMLDDKHVLKLQKDIQTADQVYAQRYIESIQAAEELPAEEGSLLFEAIIAAIVLYYTVRGLSIIKPTILKLGEALPRKPRTTDEDILPLAEKIAKKVATSHSETIKRDVSGIALKLANGRPLKELKDNEAELARFIPEMKRLVNERLAGRSKLVALNEATRAANNLSIFAAEQFAKENNAKILKRLKSSSGSPCPDCAKIIARTGKKPIPLKQSYVKNFKFDKPIGGNIHINCFVGDTRLQVPGIQKLIRAKYTGKLYSIKTASSQSLTVTSNHILLSSRGWIFAKDLVEGDQLIRHQTDVQLTALDDDSQDGVATAEDLFNSLVKLGAPVLLPASVDLHGDVTEAAEVDVIDVASFLRSRRNLSSSQLSEKQQLSLGLLDGRQSETLLSAESNPALLLDRINLVSDSFMGGGIDLSSVLDGSSLPLQFSGIAAAAEYNTRLDQASANSRSIMFSSTELDRQAKNTLPAAIAFDDVSSISVTEVDSFTVYDVQTNSSLAITNSIISSNCACYSEFVVNGKILSSFDPTLHPRHLRGEHGGQFRRKLGVNPFAKVKYSLATSKSFGSYNVPSLFTKEMPQNEEDTVNFFRKRIRQGLPVPPIAVQRSDDDTLTIRDGYHRMRAFYLEGIDPFIIETKTKDDAYSLTRDWVEQNPWWNIIPKGLLEKPTDLQLISLADGLEETDQQSVFNTLYDLLGYNAKPTVVSASAFDRRPEEEWTTARGKTKYYDAFREDDKHYVSDLPTVYGPGTYFANDTGRADEYAGKDVNTVLAAKLPEDTPLLPADEGLDSQSYTDTRLKQLSLIALTTAMTTSDEEDKDFYRARSEKLRALREINRLSFSSILMGYPGIYVDNDTKNTTVADYLVINDRGSLIVRAEDKNFRDANTLAPTVSLTVAGGKKQTFPAKYYRMGRPPQSGQSKNHATEEREAGTSVFLGYEDSATGKIFIDALNEHNELTAGKKFYEVEGEQLDAYGSDGEPLLKPGTAKIVREIDPAIVVTDNNPDYNILGDDISEDFATFPGETL